MSRSKLAELHTRWANRVAGLPGGDYVEDGPIGEDPRTYWSAPRRERIVFLLREPNAEESNDMRERVQSNASSTWRGTMALLVALAGRPLPDHLTRKALARHMDLLASVAQINVKKLKGGGESDLLELGAHLHVAADLLREQINILDPGLVLFAKTGDYLRRSLRQGEPRDGAERTYFGIQHPRALSMNRARIIESSGAILATLAARTPESVSSHS